MIFLDTLYCRQHFIYVLCGNQKQPRFQPRDAFFISIRFVLDASFTDKEVSDARDVLWPVGGVELRGECPGRNDSTKRSRRHALCCDIYDAMRKMDAADVKMPTYVIDPDGIGRQYI